ncbi:MAG: hypothetical protein JWP12_3403 [Bacteroidetes bacterium]|nr:hypothetical protein [Bacteroidota bacterium]
MKKILLILFAFILTGTLAIAQSASWVNPGATWNYQWWTNSSAGNDKIQYTHDTVIGGQSCQVLKTTRYFYGVTGPGSPISFWYSQVLPNQYTYANGDTVFYRTSSGNFHVLYNFGAVTGDTWDLGVDTNSLYCSRSIIKVDSTFSLLVGVHTHRVLYTHDSSSASEGLNVIGDLTRRRPKIVENIGSMEYLFPAIRNCDSTVVVDYYMFSFSCFSDGFNDYSVVAPGECENPFHVGIAEHESGVAFTLYPNPAENNITVSVANSYGLKVNIYNALGEMVFSEIPKDATFNIDIGRFNSGIYLISIEDKTGKKEVKRFVKN